VSPASFAESDYAGNRLDEPPLLEDAIIVTDRSLDEIQANRTLDEAAALLQREMDRLKASLETCRLLDHPRRNELVRWHVRRLDQREEALAQLKSMISANRAPGEALH
jgi:hypothetical protein